MLRLILERNLRLMENIFQRFNYCDLFLDTFLDTFLTETRFFREVYFGEFFLRELYFFAECFIIFLLN